MNLKEACIIARQNRKRIDDLFDEEVKRDAEEFDMCRTCGYGVCRYTKCASCEYDLEDCLEADIKPEKCERYISRENPDVVDDLFELDDDGYKTCDNCVHLEEEEKFCDCCTRQPQPIRRDYWKAHTPPLPDKYYGLTWNEARVLFYDGWVIVREGLEEEEFDFENQMFYSNEVIADDYKIKGRR